MSDPIFCQTDFYIKGGYRSYVDFWRLVELSGFPIIPLSQLDPQSDNTYIVTPLNDEWMHGWPDAKARIIHYELEWRWDWRADVDTPPGVSAVWTGDKYFAKQIGARYVPMGSHPGLNEWAGYNVPATYDFAFMGYKDPPRRAYMLRQMESDGLVIAPNAWGQERSRLFYKSKCMIAIHQLDNMPTIAPLRMCIAAAHKLAVISEHIEDAGIFTGLVDHFPYQDLARMAAVIIRDPHNRLKEQGEALYQLLCVDYTFRKFIELAL